MERRSNKVRKEDNINFSILIEAKDSLKVYKQEKLTFQ